MSTGKSEKIRVAQASVFAAILLTSFKLAVGIWTGSLGILSEAAHSGLDLLAALMTWFSVSYSDRPADREHPYGHHKLDNLSALFETLLLLITCFWIVYEAVQRLFFKTVEIKVNAFSFAVLLLAIVVDYTRGTALSRVAKRTRSSALEADALHFTSDIASSGVVLLGLLLTKLGYPKADPICSIGVAVLVVWISFRLGRKAVGALVDKVPGDHVERARDMVLALPGVKGVSDVRIRHSGPAHFIDLKIATDPAASFISVHELTKRVEEKLKEMFEDADVTVHAEPEDRKPRGLSETVFRLAHEADIGVHSLRIHQTRKGMQVEMHLDMPGEANLGQAHQKASALEENLKKRFPRVIKVRSHLECTLAGESLARADVTRRKGDWVSRIREAAERVDGVYKVRDIQILEGSNLWFIGLTCALSPDISLQQAHDIASRVETGIRPISPQIATINIHTEPV